MKFKEFVRMQRKYIIIGVVVLILVVSGVSYAVFQQTKSNSNNQIIRTGDLAVEYSGTGNITGELLPLTNEEGMLQAGYDFTVENIGSLPAEYVIKILNNPAGSNFIDHSNLYISFDGGEPILLSEIEVEDENADNKKYKVHVGILEIEETKEHNVKVWLKEDAPTSVIGKSVNLLIEIQIEVHKDQCDLNKNLLYCKILEENGGKVAIRTKANPNFNSISGDSDTGVYAMEDDYGTSYYFRGTKNLLNNNVIFAGFQWKIVRVNGDKSVKLIYNGECPNNQCEINTTGTSTQVGTSAFNNIFNNKKYLGYSYDTNVDSTIKLANEAWYANNLSSYDELIADTIYCNDLSGERTNDFFTYYATYDRIHPLGINYVYPSLKCANKEDRYTKNDTVKGNGLSKQKVGLITADEVMFAGAIDNYSHGATNSTYYLYTNEYYWTMTPNYFDSGSQGNSIITHYFVSSLGFFEGAGSFAPWGLRPLISLKPSIEVSGNGTVLNPYKIIE